MRKASYFTFAIFTLILSTLLASPFTQWEEYPSDPIYTPYAAGSIPDDYVPSVLYSATKFDGNGDPFFYKMWHQGPTGISLSYSDDGIHWTLVKEVLTDTPIPFHATVVYDKNGFGRTKNKYKMWYWDQTVYPTPPSLPIKYAESPDGINWSEPVQAMQDTTDFLANVAASGSFFYGFYGFSTVVYNSKAKPNAGDPYSYPYIAYYDSAAAGVSPQTTKEAVALAYSKNGISWVRFGSEPILIGSGNSSDWDGLFTSRASVVHINDTYHMFYSGASGTNNPDVSFDYIFGIGHASSSDGINWVKDTDNPIFTLLDPSENWRSGRTLASSVLLKTVTDYASCQVFPSMQMWFSGGTNNGSSIATADIGYATIEIPPYPTSCCPERMWLKKLTKKDG